MWLTNYNNFDTPVKQGIIYNSCVKSAKFSIKK